MQAKVTCVQRTEERLISLFAEAHVICRIVRPDMGYLLNLVTKQAEA